MNAALCPELGELRKYNQLPSSSFPRGAGAIHSHTNYTKPTLCLYMPRTFYTVHLHLRKNETLLHLSQQGWTQDKL